MNPTLLAAIAISLALTASEALAETLIVNVQPNGKSFTVEPVDEGKVQFMITRDPAHTSVPSDPALTVVRSAQLTVSDGKRNIVAVSVAPHINEKGHLVYSFKVSKEYAPYTTFRISETEQYKDKDNSGGYIGGGKILIYHIEEPRPLKIESTR
jgi:hypothetical protein